MMCVLREIGQHIENGVLKKDMFKVGFDSDVLEVCKNRIVLS
jgi:hypothetical protein